ncbi:hypothetical protein V6N13_047976 [Hibiscus sabdariffa]
MTWRRIIGGTEGNVEMGNVEDKTRVVIECSWLLSVLTWGTLRWMPEEAMWERVKKREIRKLEIYKGMESGIGGRLIEPNSIKVRINEHDTVSENEKNEGWVRHKA